MSPHSAGLGHRDAIVTRWKLYHNPSFTQEDAAQEEEEDDASDGKLKASLWMLSSSSRINKSNSKNNKTPPRDNSCLRRTSLSSISRGSESARRNLVMLATKNTKVQQKSDCGSHGSRKSRDNTTRKINVLNNNNTNKNISNKDTASTRIIRSNSDKAQKTTPKISSNKARQEHAATTTTIPNGSNINKVKQQLLQLSNRSSGSKASMLLELGAARRQVSELEAANKAAEEQIECLNRSSSSRRSSSAATAAAAGMMSKERARHKLLQSAKGALWAEAREWEAARIRAGKEVRRAARERGAMERALAEERGAMAEMAMAEAEREEDMAMAAEAEAWREERVAMKLRAARAEIEERRARLEGLRARLLQWMIAMKISSSSGSSSSGSSSSEMEDVRKAEALDLAALGLLEERDEDNNNQLKHPS